MDNLELKALFHMIAEHQEVPVPWDWNTGVCFNVQILEEHGYVTLVQQRRVEKLMDEWCGDPNTCYPVPASPDAMHGRIVFEPEVDCFYLHEWNHDMYTGTYGRSRREMCLYIARNL